MTGSFPNGADTPLQPTASHPVDRHELRASRGPGPGSPRDPGGTGQASWRRGELPVPEVFKGSGPTRIVPKVNYLMRRRAKKT